MNVIAIRGMHWPHAAPVAVRAWGTLVVVALAYYVGCFIGFALRFPHSGISFLWPPTWVLTAAMLLTAPRKWGFPLAGALAAHAIAHTQYGIPILSWPVQFLANAVQAGLAAALMQRYGTAPRFFGDLRSVMASIVSAAAVAPAVASLIPAYVYVRNGWAADFWQGWRARAIPNSIGALILLPLILAVWRQVRSRPAIPRPRRVAELTALMLGLIATHVIAISTDQGAAGSFVVLYAQLPFLLWAVVRFGISGLSCALLCTALLTISSVLRGQSPFAGMGPADTVLTIQLFIAVTAVPLMLMAGLLEEHRAEHRTVLELEQQHSAILRAIPDLMFLLSRDGRYLSHYAKDSAALLVPPDFFIGKHMREVLPPDVAGMFMSAFQEATTEAPAVAEYSLTLAGVTRRYEARFIALEGDRILSIVRDITKRTQAENALRESQQRYALATAAGGVGVWDLNVVTGDLYVDPALTRLLGYGDDEIGSHAAAWMRLIQPSDVEHLRSRARAHADGASPSFEAEHRMIHKDGSIRWLVTKGEIIEQVDGEAVRMTGTYTDITQRKHTERALKQANAALTRMARVTALGELTASIAHELNQPLCAIVANANACLRWLDSATPEADLRGALNDVVQDSHRASEIVRRTKELFTNRPVRKRPLNVNDLVRDVLELARPRLARTDTVLDVRLADSLPLVNADDLQIQQVLLNLVLNGIDAMRTVKDRPRSLTIQSSPGKHRVLVSVRDAGKGLGPHEIERVFDPFYTTKPNGMGIGLAISRSIVRSHGGRLWAAAHPGEGATFSFTIPAIEEPHV